MSYTVVSGQIAVMMPDLMSACAGNGHVCRSCLPMSRWPGCVDLSGSDYGHLSREFAPCLLQGCKNGPAPFPGRMSYKATKPGLVCLSYLSILYYCIVVY